MKTNSCTKSIHSNLSSVLLQTTIENAKLMSNLREQDFEIQLKISTLLKEKGNCFYKSQQDEEAINIYLKIFSLFEYLEIKDDQTYHCICHGHTKQQKKDIVELKKTILNNLAAAYLRIKSFQQAIEVASLVLESHAQDPKALFRRAKAKMQISQNMKSLQECEKDLELAYEICQDDYIQDELKQLQVLLLQQKQEREEPLQGNQGQQRTYPKEEKSLNLIMICSIILFVLIGVLLAEI